MFHRSVRLTSTSSFFLGVISTLFFVAFASAKAQFAAPRSLPSVQAVVRAEKFEMVDKSGKVLATLENKDGETHLVMTGKSAAINLKNNDGKDPDSEIGLLVQKDGTVAQTLVQSKFPFPSIVQTISPDGSMIIAMHDKNQHSHIIKTDP